MSQQPAGELQDGNERPQLIGRSNTVERILALKRDVVVCLCWNERRRERVVVRLSRLGGNRGSACERIYEEGAILGALASHPRIPNFLGGGLHGQRPFTVLQYMPGATLREQWASDRGLDLESHLRLVHDLCTVVAHAHSRNVYHRDIKPDNIVLAPDGGTSLIDWSIAHAPRLFPGSGMRRARTPAYAAPERMYDRPFSGEADDAYAVAVVAAEVILSMPSIGTGIRSGGLKQQLRSAGLGAEVARAILDTLSSSPERRGASLAGLQAELRAALVASAAVGDVAPPSDEHRGR